MNAVMRWKREPAWTLVMLGGFAILGLFLVWPLVTTFAYSFRGNDGGYVIVDDYFWAPCQQAVTEYRAKHGIEDPIEWIDSAAAFWRRSG